ncbi:MAG: guanylate kinase [Actinobacteria bacterium]|nr:guanylate kinase [Actinomycetota bacterium]
MTTKASLFVISGPSGSGKSSLIADVLKDLDNFEKSISATTRSIRRGEKDGVQYHFISKEDFEKQVGECSFLEWAEYSGYYYGTPKKFVDDKLAAGVNVILEIEVQGAMQVMESRTCAYYIFIVATTTGELRERLLKRGTDSPAEIEKRMVIAEEELKYKKHYDCIIVNNNYNEALQNLKDVLLGTVGGNKH